MWRCEEEIILKINPENVVNVLVKYFPKLNQDMKDEDNEEGEDEEPEEEKIFHPRNSSRSDTLEEMKSLHSTTADHGIEDEQSILSTSPQNNNS